VRACPPVPIFLLTAPAILADVRLVRGAGVQQPSRTGGSSPNAARGDPVPNQESLGTMWVAASPDWGRSFGAAQPFDPYRGSWGRNSLLLGLDGSWILPLYNESGKTKGHQFEHSALLRKPAGAPLLPLGAWGVGALPQPINGAHALIASRPQGCNPDVAPYNPCPPGGVQPGRVAPHRLAMNR
jgi:hypothetical protein